MATKLNEDAAAVAVYLAKLEGHHIPGIREAKSLEDLRELVSFFVIEQHQHELDMAAIRLAGPAATKDERQEAAEAIKTRIAEIRNE